MEKFLSTYHSPSLFLGVSVIMLNTIPRFIQLRDKDEETPLHCAASKGYYEGVQYLLDKSSECVLERYNNGFLINCCLSTLLDLSHVAHFSHSSLVNIF